MDAKPAGRGRWAQRPSMLEGLRQFSLAPHSSETVGSVTTELADIQGCQSATTENSIAGSSG